VCIRRIFWYLYFGIFPCISDGEQTENTRFGRDEYNGWHWLTYFFSVFFGCLLCLFEPLLPDRVKEVNKSLFLESFYRRESVLLG
jgi:hypothetical protein